MSLRILPSFPPNREYSRARASLRRLSDQADPQSRSRRKRCSRFRDRSRMTLKPHRSFRCCLKRMSRAPRSKAPPEEARPPQDRNMRIPCPSSVPSRRPRRCRSQRPRSSACRSCGRRGCFRRFPSSTLRSFLLRRCCSMRSPYCSNRIPFRRRYRRSMRCYGLTFP